MNGGVGKRRRSLRSTFVDRPRRAAQARRPASFAASSFSTRNFSGIELAVADARPAARRTAAACCPSSCAVIDQYSIGLERLDLALALADDAHRDRLHAAGRQPAAHLLPEQRADLVADQAVEDAARLLRLEQVLVELLRVLERLLDRALGDLVEQHAADVACACRRAARRCARRSPRPRGRVGRQVDVLLALRRLAAAR